MALIGAVALIVIGPEKLPRVARTVGTLLGKAQRYVADVKAEVNRSMELDELRKMKDFPALEGAISFGSNGDALKPVYVIQLQDGKWTLIGQFPPES